MLLELLISAALMLTLLGMVFGLLNPAHGAIVSVPQTADMHQRLRAAGTQLHRELLMAGSGPTVGTEHEHALTWLRAPIVPGRLGRGAVVRTTANDEAVTTLHAIPGAVGARLATTVPSGGMRARVTLMPGRGCHRPPRCGVDARLMALVFDESGRSDMFRVTRARRDTVWLRHLSGGSGASYPPGAWVVPVRVRSYYLDRRRGQLRVHDGWATDLPFIDGVVDIGFEYFGGPLPTATTVPSVRQRVVAPCLARAASPAPTGAPAPAVRALSLDRFVDGPWCGGGAPFDVDVFRIRRVRVEMRLRVAEVAWRGVREPLLVPPSAARVRPDAIPDLATRFDVSPRSVATW